MFDKRLLYRGFSGLFFILNNIFDTTLYCNWKLCSENIMFAMHNKILKFRICIFVPAYAVPVAFGH